MVSETKGHIGASSSESVVSTACRVAWAANVSLGGASGSVRQKRLRLRRTYQFETSSTNDATAWAASRGSYEASAAVAVDTVPESRDRIQRSSSPRSAGAGMTGSDGSKPFSDA